MLMPGQQPPTTLLLQYLARQGGANHVASRAAVYLRHDEPQTEETENDYQDAMFLNRHGTSSVLSPLLMHDGVELSAEGGLRGQQK